MLLLDSKDKFELKDYISMYTQTETVEELHNKKVDVGTDANAEDLVCSAKDAEIKILQQEVKDLKKKNGEL